MRLYRIISLSHGHPGATAVTPHVRRCHSLTPPISVERIGRKRLTRNNMSIELRLAFSVQRFCLQIRVPRKLPRGPCRTNVHTGSEPRLKYSDSSAVVFLSAFICVYLRPISLLCAATNSQTHWPQINADERR